VSLLEWITAKSEEVFQGRKKKLGGLEASAVGSSPREEERF